MKHCCDEARRERNRGILFMLIVVALLVIAGRFE